MKNRQFICKKQIINLLLLIIWMIFIFYMSAQPAEVSDSQSFGLINILLSKFHISVDNEIYHVMNFLLRKCAHFLEYMILAFLALNVVRHSEFNINSPKAALITIVFVFLYACTDEVHQLFVPGREGALRDVIIDTSGGITLTLLYLLAVWIRKNKK